MKYRIRPYCEELDVIFHIEQKKHWWNIWKSIEQFECLDEAEARFKELREIENDKKFNHTDFSDSEWLYLRNRIANQKWYNDDNE